MGKLVLIIMVVYIIYYLGNIIYDLYVHKENKIEENKDSEVYILGNDENNQVTNIDLDDVEELTLSVTQEIDENDLFIEEEERQKEDMDNSISEEDEEYIEVEELDVVFKDNNDKVEDVIADKEKEIKSDKFKNLLKMAETLVTVEEGENGRIYRPN